MGALTVGVTLGLDWACKRIYKSFGYEEKGLTEAISDHILNAGEGVIVGAKKVTSSVASFVKSGWSNLKSSAGRGFSPIIQHIRRGIMIEKVGDLLPIGTVCQHLKNGTKKLMVFAHQFKPFRKTQIRNLTTLVVPYPEGNMGRITKLSVQSRGC